MSNEPEIGILDIRKIISALKQYRDIDFENYALSSFRYRMKKAIKNLGLNDTYNTDTFVEEIKVNTDFFNALIIELEVPVTELFRDPSLWVYLRDFSVPSINKNSKINIWIPCCSTGEEALSMAIVIKDTKLASKVVITATNFNDDLLQLAKNRVYHSKDNDINYENYQKYKGNREGNEIDIKEGITSKEELLKLINFKTHDITSSKSLGLFNLILFRNNLIYFNNKLQDDVVQMLTDSLLTNGLLIIGNKENIKSSPSYHRYIIENTEEKIFRKKL